MSVTGTTFTNAAINRCESPIERMFLASLLAAAAQCNVRLHLHDGPETITVPVVTHTSDLHVYPQWRHGAYRCDFKLVSEYDRKSQTLVVECDGHDYHERTKQQARKDRARDRALAADGYQVFRFTGSEIWRNSHKCAAECLAKLYTGEGE